LLSIYAYLDVSKQETKDKAKIQAVIAECGVKKIEALQKVLLNCNFVLKDPLQYTPPLFAHIPHTPRYPHPPRHLPEPALPV